MWSFSRGGEPFGKNRQKTNLIIDVFQGKPPWPDTAAVAEQFVNVDSVLVSFDLDNVYCILSIVVQGLDRNIVIVSVVDEVGTMSDSVQEAHILSAKVAPGN